jgi:Invasion associated locus B (IalB) protein
MARPAIARLLLLVWALSCCPASAQDERPAAGAAEQVSPAPPPALPASQEKRFGDWSTIRLELKESRLCFAVTRARPASARGAAAPENGISHVHVATWPEAGVKAEVSVRAGTSLRLGAPAQLAISNEQFTLFTKQEGAFVENPIDELKLLEAMKRGSQMTFTAQTEAGNAVSETFSLAGLAAALAHVTQGCP